MSVKYDLRPKLEYTRVAQKDFIRKSQFQINTHLISTTITVGIELMFKSMQNNDGSIIQLFFTTFESSDLLIPYL